MGGGAPPPHPTIFFETLPNQNPPWGTPLLKNEAPPSEKQTSPPPPRPSPLKCEAPFHEMIPRKSTTNNNFKKIYLKSFKNMFEEVHF